MAALLRFLQAAVDARVLVWLVIIIFASGLPLMLWFDADEGAHAEDQPAVAPLLRGVHGVATAWLVIGTLGHFLLRLGRRVHWRHMLTGGIAFLVVGAGAISGALAAQTSYVDRLGGAIGVGALSEQAVLVAAVLHVAYTAILVTLALYVHIVHHGLARVVSRPVPALWAFLIVALGVVAFGGSSPGSAGGWEGAAWIATPAVPVLWAWTLLIGMAAVGSSLWMRGRQAA